MKATIPFLGCILCLGCTTTPTEPKSPQPTSSQSTPRPPRYVLPEEFQLDALSQRTGDGAIVISGATNLPDGMKMWVEVMEGSRPGATDGNVVIRNGRYASVGLTNKDRPYAPGTYRVRLTAYFNGAWQSRELLSVVGDGGKNLHGKLFRLTDPDVADSDRILEYVFVLHFPPLSEDVLAITTVKHAILTVPEHGRSATDIEDNLKLFTTPGTGVLPGKGWSAQSKGNRTYLVTYDFISGPSGPDQAVWSVDLNSKTVKYVNKNAKIFSWTPRD